MKRAPAVLLILGVLGAPAKADEPPFFAEEPDLDALASIAESAKPFRDQWQECTTEVAKRNLNSRSSDAAVAGRALDGCRDEEQEFRKALAGKVGAREAASIVSQLRAALRTNLTAAIAAIRAERQ